MYRGVFGERQKRVRMFSGDLNAHLLDIGVLFCNQRSSVVILLK